MRLAVHLQREVARLHYYDPQQSSRGIARATGISPNTVRNMRKLLRACPRSWGELAELDDSAWTHALDNKDRTVIQRKPAPDWEHIHAEMARPDATLEILWQEWRSTNPDGIAYTAFTTKYRDWQGQRNIVFRMPQVPGAKMFVDYAGRQVKIHGAYGQPDRYASIFVAVLGFSNYTYVQAVWTQGTSDWVQCHSDCFEFFGGAPLWVISDNLKAAVWRREKERIVINPSYRDCLVHYDTAAQPARPRRPRDKGRVEVGVKIIQRWILFRLRDRVFFSLEELNSEIQRLLIEFNNHRFKRLPGSRQTRFDQEERKALKPLPAIKFELTDWRYAIKAGNDYHVEHAGCWYSVPHQYAAARVDLRFTNRIVEIFFQNRRIALHELLEEKGKTRTQDDHRPVSHVRVLEGEPQSLSQWSKCVGVHTAAMIAYHLEDRADQVNGLKTARRLRQLARDFGESRLEEVCAYALPRNLKVIRSIESILRTQSDRQVDGNLPTDRSAPHENIRGADYYKDTGATQ